MDSLSPVLL
uniref:Uncharacterized protein n=1 Tax=Anguilla anguilla TaxID=7936 RepID=A0A0E9UCM6_ANGAN